MNEVVKARTLLDDYGVAADVWSVTSYKELYRDGHGYPSVEHAPSRQEAEGAVRDAVSRKYCRPHCGGFRLLKALAETVSRWCPKPMVTLGTDGFGRSEGRSQLRDFFEVDSRYIALATLHSLAQEGQLESKVVQKAMKDLEIDPEKIDPATA